MSTKQRIAIVVPVVLVAVMYPVFQLLAKPFRGTWRIGWYLGLAVYWLIWGVAFPMLLVGRERIARLIRPRRLTVRVLLLAMVPLVGASIYRLVPGMEYHTSSWWELPLLLSSCLGNGLFEEVLWRGVYMEMFPENILLRIVWPSIWFALWHYLPGSVNPNGNALGLIIGSGLMGFYLSFLAKKTDTVWWAIVGHTLGGIIMVV
ncbi:MAG: CPBP family intramembrane metalloprotease [Anaerolineae bacterium]|jgi:membrane protease YdiL (CAAX protease family)